MILRAAHPAAKAIEALTLTGPLFLLLFASTYFLMSQADGGNFNVSGLTRSDTLYFTVTVFTTVGFGDIVATSHSARALVTVQMILDLILIGAVIRAFVEAVRDGPKESGHPVRGCLTSATSGGGTCSCPHIGMCLTRTAGWSQWVSATLPWFEEVRAAAQRGPQLARGRVTDPDSRRRTTHQKPAARVAPRGPGDRCPHRRRVVTAG